MIWVQNSSTMDQCLISASAFHRLADRYREKFMDLTVYDHSYREFCDLLPPGAPGSWMRHAAQATSRVTCWRNGPIWTCWGLTLHRGWWNWPERRLPARTSPSTTADVWLSSNRVSTELSVPLACRTFPWEEAAVFIRAAGAALEPGGMLYLSTMLGGLEDSGFEQSVMGNRSM